jgi:hypothetical protein
VSLLDAGRLALRIASVVLSLDGFFLMKRISRRMLLLVGLVALAFALGYRLPWMDRHPEWEYFPGLTNPHLVVEEIPAFDSIYGRRFPFTREGVAAMFYDDCYRTNLQQVRSVGYQVTGNEFVSGIHWPLSSWPGAADMGHPDDLPVRRGFKTEGYQYLSLQLGSQVGYFKDRFRETPTALTQFYQYNHPRTTRDTLYLRYREFSYRIFYR